MNQIDAPLTVVRNVITAPLNTAQSAYGMWRTLGNSGTPQDFLDSLVGAAGSDGVVNSPTPPTDTSVLWLDPDDFTISAWNGTTWVVVD
jgi:hypothetical protein